jgi:hypothetical protein
VTRDYVFDLDTAGGGAPLLSIFGGKITTYRKLAEHALRKLAPLLGVDSRPWTGDTPLTGGDIPGADMDAFLRDLTERYGWLPAPLLDRWAHAYGTRITEVIGEARSLDDLGVEVAPGACTRRNWSICATANGRAPPRTCCGAGPSWACAVRMPRSPRWMPGSVCGPRGASAPECNVAHPQNFHRAIEN